MTTQPNYAAHWAALLAKHRAYITAGCISPIGVHRAGVKKANDDADEQRPVPAELGSDRDGD